MLDELVKKGVFSSRAEAYRAGALLVATLPGAQKLRVLGQLDNAIYGTHLKKCVAELKKFDHRKARLELGMALDALRTRALIGPLLGEKVEWSQDYESLAADLSHYEQVLSEFDKFDQNTRKGIIEDLRRDIAATLEGIKSVEDEIRYKLAKHPQPVRERRSKAGQHRRQGIEGENTRRFHEMLGKRRKESAEHPERLVPLKKINRLALQ